VAVVGWELGRWGGRAEGKGSDRRPVSLRPPARLPALLRPLGQARATERSRLLKGPFRERPVIQRPSARSTGRRSGRRAALPSPHLLSTGGPLLPPLAPPHSCSGGRGGADDRPGR